METGLISNVVENKGFYVFVPFPNTYKIDQQGITEVFIDIPDPRKHSPKQHKKVFGLINEIARWSSGYLDVRTMNLECEYIRAEMTQRFCTETGIESFSMSNADMTTVRYFIDYLVEFCIINQIPCRDNTLLGYCEDISKYIYACLANKICCITGKKAELHHVDAVGMGRNRKEIIHKGMQVLPLDRKSHIEAHTIGKTAFNQKYHVYGIIIDDYLCKIWNLRSE